MGLLSSIGQAIKAAIKKVVDWIVKAIKKWWWVILIVVAIYYAPALALWAQNVGAPEWIVSGLKGLAPLSKMLSSALEGGASLLKWVGDKWELLGAWEKVAYVAGAMFMLAPEEMKEVAREATEEITHGVSSIARHAGEAAGQAVKALANGLGFHWLVPVLIGGWFLLAKRDDDDDYHHQRARHILAAERSEGGLGYAP